MKRVILGLMLCFSILRLQAAPFVISATQGNPINEPGYLIVSRAYERLGIQTELREFPASRALMMANSGKVDAELGRNPIIEKNYVNLLRIPVQTLQLHTVAITMDQEAAFSEWADLRPLSVGYVRGALRVEARLSSREMMAVNNPVQLLDLLRSGRADAIVVNQIVARHIVRQQPDASKFHSQIIDTETPYHYVHKKHIELVEDLVLQFQSMKSSGEMKRILANYIQRRWPEEETGFGTGMVEQRQ